MLNSSSWKYRRLILDQRIDRLRRFEKMEAPDILIAREILLIANGCRKLLELPELQAALEHIAKVDADGGELSDEELTKEQPNNILTLRPRSAPQE